MARRARPRIPRLSSAERRALIVAAAVRVILRKGLQATQVGDVVREAGVSRGTFYLHFESKGQLVAAAVRELLDRMLPRFPTPLALASRGDLEAALGELHRQTLAAADRERASARLVLLGGGGSEPAAARWLATHEESWKRVIERLLVRARTARLIREGVDVGFAADCIVGSVQRVMRAHVLLKREADVAALAHALARFHAEAIAR